MEAPVTFIALIAKNLLRQRARTVLTVLGISVGITTVVALGVVVGGMRMTAQHMIRAYDSDFIVARKGAADLTLSTVSEEEADGVAARSDVERTIRALFDITQVGDNPYFATIGVRPEDIAETPPNLVEGAILSADATDEIMLGNGAAGNLRASVGSIVNVEKRDYRVVAIYHTGNTWEDNGAIVPLSSLQEATGKRGTVTAVYVSVRAGTDPEAVAGSIREQSPLLTTVKNLDEMSRVDQGIVLMDALNLAVSALAVGIGAIGVMNTMVMSVYERTREIGILRAVGWRGSRILRMIVGESLLLCLVATVVGSGLGVLASRLVLLFPAVRSLLEPTYTIDIFVRGLVVAIAVALVGAIYPAIRAVRLSPMEALRHE
jgi:putative ABC transport system permease protein